MTTSPFSVRRLWVFCLLFIGFLLPKTAWADISPGQVEPDFNVVGSGKLWLRGQSGHSDYAPLLNTDVDMAITGLLARVTLTQYFTNAGDDWAEGVYVFPLPADAAVDHMRLRIGERVIEGVIREKQAARRQYRAAKKAGKRASLLSQQRPNIFTVAVANIAPGEEVRVEIEYQQSVRLDEQLFSIRFPMTITPRYMPGRALRTPTGQPQRTGTGVQPDTDSVADASQISPALSRRGDNDNPVHIRVNLAPGFELSDLESPYHQVDKRRLAPGQHQIVLKSTAHDSNSDFVLRWRAAKSEEPRVSLFTQEWKGEHYSLLMLAPPVQPAAKKRLPRDVVFVIDTSGSMGGEPLRQARRALLLAIERLQPQDRFNVIEFNSASYALFNQVRDASDANRARALSYVRALTSRGGTEMAGAIDAALTQGGGAPGVNTSSRVRQVIFLTDGAVGNEDQLFGLIENKLDNSRLFTVGIGSAPNAWFMRKAAELGRGSFTYIGKLNEVSEQMTALFHKLEAPVMSDLRVTFAEGQAVEIYPVRVPDLYRGEPLVVAFKTDELPQYLQVSGNREDRLFTRQLAFNSAQSRPGVNVLWARRKLGRLMDDYRLAYDPGIRENLKAEVTDVALVHHLVSQFTSLVAVDKTPARRPSESLESHALKNNPPKGTRFTLPQTATSGELRIYAGLCILLLAMVWYLIRYRPQNQPT